MNRRERWRHEAAMRIIAAAEAKARTPEAVRRRAEPQAEAEQTLDADEIERLRLQQEAELIATADADPELAACVAAIEQAEPVVIEEIVAMVERLVKAHDWMREALADGDVRLVMEDDRVCIADVDDPIERLKCQRRYRRLKSRWRELGGIDVKMDAAMEARAIANAFQLGLLTHAPRPEQPQ